MSDYRRLISYIYEYEGKEKGKNVGFVKLEARNGQCRLNVNVKKIYMGGNAIGVYLLGKGGQETFLGNMFVRSGNGEFRITVDAENVEGSGSGLDTYYGLTVHDVKNAWRCYTTIWEDAVTPAMEILPAAPKELTSGVVSNVVREIEKEIAREEKMAHAAELETDGEPEAEMGTADAAWQEAEDRMETVKGQEAEDKTETVSGPEPEAGTENATGHEVGGGVETVKRKEVEAGVETAKRPESEAGVETAKKIESEVGLNSAIVLETEVGPNPATVPETAAGAETAGILGTDDGLRPADEADRTAESGSGAAAKLKSADIREGEFRPETADEQERESGPEKAAAMPEAGQTPDTAPAMPQHVLSPELENPEVLKYLQETEDVTADPEKLWAELKKSYPKIRPFDYEDGCEVLTIRPQDIGRLPRESWVYGNNSFLLHGYYNFRYLILVRLGGERKKPRYLIGVPGHYYSNEKYMASMFGFPNFVLSKKQPANDGRFGYWYTDIRVR